MFNSVFHKKITFILLISCLSKVCNKNLSDTCRVVPRSVHASALTCIHKSLTAEQIRIKASSTKRDVTSPSDEVIELKKIYTQLFSIVIICSLK